jgi:hypothetical protein
MDEFSLPEDITALNDEELDALLEGAVRAFDAKAGSTTVENVRAEKVERTEAAEKAAAEIDKLPASVRGDDPEQTAAVEPAEPSQSPAQWNTRHLNVRAYQSRPPLRSCSSRVVSRYRAVFSRAASAACVAAVIASAPVGLSRNQGRRRWAL